MKSANRKIPATMATQHPDHAHTPYWHHTPFISTQEEVYEAYLSFSELGITEYKWDWEGKLVDEAVIERMLALYFDYFKSHPIGEDKFLTFRLPNPKVETEFRLGRAFMGIIAASSMARHFGLSPHPLFEVILPMTETSAEMIGIQEAFREIASLKHPLLKRGAEDIGHIEIIPLFEDIYTIANSDKILEEYLEHYQNVFGETPAYMRPYVARSDPALNAGIIPTVLAIKIALSRYHSLSIKREIPLFPIIGAAALPFRGGVSPLTVDSFMNEYKGIRTTTIQSAFRYDFPKEIVIEALQKLEKNLSLQRPMLIPADEIAQLEHIMQIGQKYYRSSIEKLAPLINTISAFIPKRRERVQHTGLFGYSRGVGKVSLPRAITFTASLYSLGVPPEIIGTGRALKEIKEQNLLDLLEKYYINICSDLMNALKYTDIEYIYERSKTDELFEEIKCDVEEILKFLNKSQKDLLPQDKEHIDFSKRIRKGLDAKSDVISLVQKAAFLRRSLG